MEQQVETPLSSPTFIALLGRFCRLTASYRHHPDRRATCRFHVEEGTVPVTIRAGGSTVSGLLANISSSGAQIIVDEPVSPAAKIELVFTMGNERYRRRAHVARSQEDHGGYALTTRFEPGPFLHAGTVSASEPEASGQS